MAPPPLELELIAWLAELASIAAKMSAGEDAPLELIIMADNLWKDRSFQVSELPSKGLNWAHHLGFLLTLLPEP